VEEEVEGRRRRRKRRRRRNSRINGIAAVEAYINVENHTHFVSLR